jgi:hypothetical protein
MTLRLRGELRMKQGQSKAAETDFRKALALAGSMGAKLLELQASISLARLLNQQGRRDEPASDWTKSYNWFTEGFDTADLKEGKTRNGI